MVLELRIESNEINHAFELGPTDQQLLVMSHREDAHSRFSRLVGFVLIIN